MEQPYLTTEWIDKETGAKGYLVIDELKKGFCAGGIRMREGLTKKEVERLADIMTVKMAGLGLPLGGAKGGIDFPSNHPKSKEVLKRYLEAHVPYLREYWLTSEDLGTREEDISKIISEFGLFSSVQAYIDKQENSEDLTRELKKAMEARYDGTALTDLVTGYGTAIVTMKGLEFLGKEKRDSKVSIQGFGSVGASAAKFLYEYGIKVVSVADIKGTIYYEEGLDIPLLLSLKNSQGTIDREKLPVKYKQLPLDGWLTENSDILIPAAVADAINMNNVGNVKAELIVEGANIPITQDAEEKLFEQGVLVIPDFIANSGGAGLFVSILYGNVKGEPNEILDFLKNQLTKTAERVLTIAKNEQLLPRNAAKQLVES